MVDVMGALVTELRNDSGVAAAVGSLNHQVKVWGEEKPSWKDFPPDPRNYVLLHDLVPQRMKRVPVVMVRFAVTCVGKDWVQTSAVYSAVSDALHDKGPRIDGHTGIWRTYEDTGGQSITDPQTHWPAKIAIFECWAATVPMT